MSAGPISIDDLRALVDVEPQRALDVARQRLGAGATRPADIAALWWVAGLAERQLGSSAQARASLEEAVRLAASSEDAPLHARVTISLALDVGNAGDVPGALALLDAVEPDVDDRDRAWLAIQRGLLLYRHGRLAAAVESLAAAHALASRAGDVLTALQVLVNLGAVESQQGAFDVARDHLLEAVTIAFSNDQISLGALALANLAYVETTEGNLPEALDAFASAEDGLRLTGTLVDLPRLHADHALALADANLLDDAEHLIDRAVELSAAGGNDLELAELLLVSAEIDLAKDKPDEAHVSAANAVAAFTRQGRDSWLHVAERLRLRAEARLTPDAPEIAAGLVMNGRALMAGGWRSDALSSMLLAALLHAEHDRLDDARALLAEVGPAATRGRGADQLLLGRVAAILAVRSGHRGAARRAVTAGLRAAAAGQAALGSLEARSHAAHHGAELIELGAALAIEDRRPRELLHRIESMRTMVWRAPLVRAPDDATMAALLSDLRRSSASASDPDADADARRHADRDRLRIEREIRDLSRRARGPRGEATTTEDAVADAIAALGGRDLIAYANLAGRLHAVVVRSGRCTLHDLGAAAALDDHLEVSAFALHRLNRVQGSAASRAAAGELLAEAAAALAGQLLPPIVARGDRPLVVVPTGVLHGVPWGALAPLRGRPVSVSPSLSAWAAAAQVASPDRREVALIAGPGLRFADEELTALAAIHDGAAVVPAADSSAEGTIELFGACGLVHLACHGTFRTDNPLFSTLALADGPLTVYDLQRAASMPEVVVLSACSVGTSAAINGGTLLGLSSALGAFGAAAVIAPLTPVSDEHVLAVMLRLHTQLAAGAPPAAALAAATAGDAELDPVGAAFVALGV
jgi:tetratricopeptide (TPR) repeat protein